MITKWKSSKSSYKDAIEYIKGRKIGTIKSIKTPWPKFNDATTDGIEWNSLTVIAGRPAAGKTAIKDQIIREAFALNPDQDFRVLEFQFEMVGRVTAIRHFSSHLKKTYKHLCSADGKISENDLEACIAYSKNASNYPIDIVDEPITVPEIEQIIDDYMKTYATKTENGVIYKNTIVTLDHSLLVKKASYEKDKYDMLYNLGETITKLKRKYPIAFIVLTQLNRNIDSPDRVINGTIGNYVMTSDIFGADALLQHAETVIGINRPGLYKIRYYGPDKFIIDDENVLAFHFLKCRNGDTRISFFKAMFQEMRILEISPPSKKNA